MGRGDRFRGLNMPVGWRGPDSGRSSGRDPRAGGTVFRRESPPMRHALRVLAAAVLLATAGTCVLPSAALGTDSLLLQHATRLCATAGWLQVALFIPQYF